MIRNYTDHAANERTFLAWVRTAVAIVGFGLAVARFGNTYREYRRRVPRFVPWRPPVEVNASPIA